MSVENVVNIGQFGTARAGHALHFAADGVFDDRLRIGEILQGKVTKHFDGSRYSVNFGGTEKVVDSALPLTRGELLYGRVVGLDDKVVLQRVYPGQTQAAAEQKAPLARNGNQAELQELFAQYKAKLTPSIQAQVLPLMKAHSTPALIALSSLILSKLGLPAEQTLMRAVSKTLDMERQSVDAERHKIAPALKAEPELAAKIDLHLIDELAVTLALLSDPRPPHLAPNGLQGDEAQVVDSGLVGNQSGSHESSDGQGEHRGKHDELLGYWILNAQNVGSVSHRLVRLPIWFGERLLEVDVAMFSQRDSTVKGDSVRHRKIVLSLKTEGLGHVELTVHAADKHLRLHFFADSEQASDTLAEHFGDIGSVVDALGWVVDEVRYAVLPMAPDGLMRSVAEHFITNDSLNRVM